MDSRFIRRKLRARELNSIVVASVSVEHGLDGLIQIHPKLLILCDAEILKLWIALGWSHAEFARDQSASRLLLIMAIRLKVFRSVQQMKQLNMFIPVLLWV